MESHVRLGSHILSPLIPKGEADVMIAMEQSEPLRYLDYPKSEATILVSNVRIIPPSVTAGNETYPGPLEIQSQLETHFSSVSDIGEIKHLFSVSPGSFSLPQSSGQLA